MKHFVQADRSEAGGSYHVIGRPQIDHFRLGIEDFEQIRRMVPLR